MKAPEITRRKLSKGITLVKRGEIWHLEVFRNGRWELRRSLQTSDPSLADCRAIDVLGGGAELVTPFLRRKPKSVGLTLEEGSEKYEDWYRENRRKSGADRALPVVRMFVEAVGPERDTLSITRADVQNWVDSRVGGRSPATVRCDFGKVRAFLFWLARRKNVVDMDSCRGIDKPKDTRTTRAAPSTDKVRAVLAKLSRHPWLGDFARVLAETGMRPSELLGVRGIDFRDRFLSIVPWEGRGLKSEWSRRTIELNDQAAAILKSRAERIPDRSRPIFANASGGVYAERSVYHYFRNELGGGDSNRPPEALDMTLYDFRHFFCSEHAAPGPQHMDIEALAAYMGHSATSTRTLLRWYADPRALRRGAPVPLLPQGNERKVAARDHLKWP